MISDSKSTCPKCGGQLKYYDTVLRVEAFLSTVSDMAEIICHAGWVSEQLAEIDTAEQDK